MRFVHLDRSHRREALSDTVVYSRARREFAVIDVATVPTQDGHPSRKTHRVSGTFAVLKAHNIGNLYRAGQ